MVELDGATGEGGGQILRSGLSLAMCTGQPLRIHQIRAGRAKPGLMRQHLACVQAAQAVCGARVEGAELGSMTLLFEPGGVVAGDYRFVVGTAGSCMLVLQTVLPALMVAPGVSRLTLTGGTHNPMAPSFHFIERCFAPLLQRLGVGLALELRRHGFYPAGGGEVGVRITPATALVPFDLLARGAPVAACAECLVPGLARRIALRQLALVGEALGWPQAQLHTPPTRQNEGPGNALMATLVYEQVTELVTSFGERGVSSEQVAAQLVAELRAYQQGDAALGPHLADQWALPLALAVHASGRAASFTCVELTEHTRTNLAVIQRFLPLQASVQPQGTGWCVSLAGRSISKGVDDKAAAIG